jgi:hypothetical protein
MAARPARPRRRHRARGVRRIGEGERKFQEQETAEWQWWPGLAGVGPSAVIIRKGGADLRRYLFRLSGLGPPRWGYFWGGPDGGFPYARSLNGRAGRHCFGVQ